MKSGRLLMLMLGMALASSADQLPECSWGRGSGARILVAEGELRRTGKKEERELLDNGNVWGRLEAMEMVSIMTVNLG